MPESANERIISTKRRFRQNRLSFRIALITFISALVGILGVFRLSWNMHQIAEKYNHIMERDYRNVAYICPQCHEVFRPSIKEVFFAKHTPKTRRLTCAKCGHHGFCVETYGGEVK